MPSVMSCGWRLLPGVLSLMVAVARADTPTPNPLAEELRKASAAYAEAFNKRDYTALADQWTLRAELVEGGSRLEGRDRIVASIKAWRERHPDATLAIELRDVESLSLIHI